MSESRKRVTMNHADHQNEESSGGPIDWDLPEEFKLLETQLKSLSPRPDRLDRERLIFLAGQASVEDDRALPSELQPSRWAWPASFATMTAVAAALLLMLLTRPSNVPMTLAPADELAPIESFRPTLATDQTSRILGQNILSSAPNQLKQIEQLLASDSLPAESSVDAGSAREWMDHRMLTPTSFQMLLDEPTRPGPSPLDSSFLSPEAGAYS